MDNHKFKLISPNNSRNIPQTNNHSLKKLLTPPNRSSEMHSQYSKYRLVHKPKQPSQTAFYETPLLNSESITKIDHLKKLDKNDFYTQLNSQDPYQYPKTLRDLKELNLTNKQSSMKVFIPSGNTDSCINFSCQNNIQLRKSRQRLHRGIPQKLDVLTLSEWVDLMLNQALKLQQSEDIFNEIQHIFTYSLKELVRQISMDCVEKSVLLERIWTQYVDINQQVFEQILNDKSSEEKQSLQQLKRTHQTYQKQIDNYLLIINNIKEEKAILTDRFMKMKEMSKYLKKANRNLLRDYKLTKFDINDLKNQNKYLENEVQKYKDYIDDAERDLKIQENNIKLMSHQQKLEELNLLTASQMSNIQNSPTSSARRRLTRSETQSFNLNANPDHAKFIKIMRVSNRNRTIVTNKTIIQEEKEKQVLKDDEGSEDMSNLEDILAEKGTSTEDLIELMGLTQSQEVQTIVSKIRQVNKTKKNIQFLRPDQRQQVMQTDISCFNIDFKEVQTEINEEVENQLNNEDQELNTMIEDEILQASKNLLSPDSSPTVQIDSFMNSVARIQAKMKSNIEKQRQFRSSIMLQSTNYKDEVAKKSQQINQLKQQNGVLQEHLDLAQQELSELENQVEVYDELNKKIESKYQKIKTRKQMIIEKTQNLVTNISKTYQFRDIMKKKLLERKKKTSQQQESSLSQANLEQLQQNQQQQQQQQQQKKWNIQITIPQETKQQSQDDADSFQSDNLSQKSAITPRSMIEQVDNQIETSRSQRQSVSPQKQNKSQQQFQLIPNNKKQSKSSRRPSASPNGRSQNSNPQLNSSNEHIKFIQDTIQNFLNENLSDDNSSESSSFSVSTRLQELQNRKLQMQNQRKAIAITMPQAPKFNHRPSENANVNQQRSAFIIAQVADKILHNPKSIKPKMQKINVLKMISQFYIEKVKQFQNKNAPLHLICYEYYFNTYGFKNLAEQKLINFYHSVYVYQQSYRISLFGRFLELFNALTLDDLEIYIQSLKYLDENEVPLNLAQVVNEKGVFVLLDRAINLLDQQHSGIPQDLKNQIIKDIKTSMVDRNGKQCIDVDFFLSKLLAMYHIMRNIHQAHFEEVFYAADMDLDGMIEYQEFKKLFYHFEMKQGNPMNEQQIQRKFLQQCDLVADEAGEKAMSYGRFVTFSIENNLFTEEKFLSFANKVGQEDPIKTLEDVSLNWANIKEQFKKRIQDSEEDLDYYFSIIKKLEKALQSEDKKRSLWISYRIIDTDTKDLYLKVLVNTLIPDEYLKINEWVQEMIENQ